MADNVTVTNRRVSFDRDANADYVVAADDVGGAYYQRVKIVHGINGESSGDVSDPNPLPISFPAANQSAFGTLENSELTPVVQLDFIYGINTQTGVSTTANSATVDTNGGRLRLQCGTNSAGSAIFNSRKIIKYRPGQGMTARFTGVFANGTANNTQIIGCGSSSNGYFIGYNGTSFGILHRNGGSDTWTAQASFNGDTLDGTGLSGVTITPQYGNVYMIKYPFLGYGNIEFFVQHPNKVGWILFHTIRYTNTVAAVQLGNPNLFFYAQNLNSGNTENRIMYVGSVGIFLSGKRDFSVFPKQAFDNYKTGITTENAIFAVRNATTYNGVTNRSLIRLQSLSFSASTAASQTCILRIVLGTTLGGSPSFTCRDGTTADNGVTITSGNSIASCNTAGTTLTGGTRLYTLCFTSGSGAGGLVVDLMPFEIFLAPTETLTVSGFATGSATIAAGLNWIEEI